MPLGHWLELWASLCWSPWDNDPSVVRSKQRLQVACRVCRREEENPQLSIFKLDLALDIRCFCAYWDKGTPAGWASYFKKAPILGSPTRTWYPFWSWHNSAQLLGLQQGAECSLRLTWTGCPCADATCATVQGSPGCWPEGKGKNFELCFVFSFPLHHLCPGSLSFSSFSAKLKASCFSCALEPKPMLGRFESSGYWVPFIL